LAASTACDWARSKAGLKAFQHAQNVANVNVAIASEISEA
jgi:hypothetical protein